MKPYRISLLSFLLFFSLACAAEKYALIIAIGDYPDPGINGWPKISSGNDAPLIRGALQSQGFKTENISLLKDAAATKDGIASALDQLTSRVNAGDVVVIHVSSHGEQIEDDNGDEVDGLDETIVPYGAKYSYEKEKFKDYAPGYFRDDLFGQKITSLRNKLGKNGDVLVLLDACHSGTGTRGVSDAKVRGAKPPMVSRGFDMSQMGKPDTAGVFKDNNGVTLKPDAATYALISGAQAQESNYECNDDNGNPVGSLSYAFSKSIASLTDKTTYRGLFADIENIMRDKAPKQKPVLEGDGIDRMLFGGNYFSQKPYFTVQEWKTDDEFTINAGTIAGLTTGSVVSLFPAPTLDPTGKTPLNKGTVTAATNFGCTVKLDKPDTLFKTNPWIFITEMAYGSNKLKLAVRDINGSAKEVEKLLSDFPLVEFNKACDVYLDTCGLTTVWALKYPNTGDVFIKDISVTGAPKMNDLKSSLKRFDRYRYLQGLNFDEDELTAKVELVFLKNKKEVDYAKTQSRIKNGRLELKDGDVVYLKIVNTGDKRFFINIVDIQPDGKINPILPSKYINPPVLLDECEIAKNDSVIMDHFQITIGPPYGDETFKVFLSKEPIDLEDILTKADDSKSRNSRGKLSNMAKVFMDSEVKQNGTRGGTGKVNTDQNGTTFSVPFIIVPR